MIADARHQSEPSGTGRPERRPRSQRRPREGVRPRPTGHSPLRAHAKSAAASAEPPPMPAAAGKRFISRNRPTDKPGTRAANSRAARKTRFPSAGPASSAFGPSTLEVHTAARLISKPIAHSRKRDQALDSCSPSCRRPTTRNVRLILAGARRQRMSGGVDRYPPPRFCAASVGGDGSLGTSGRPTSIFFKIAGKSSGSGPKSRAWFH